MSQDQGMQERRAFWELYYAGQIEGDNVLVEQPSPFALEVSLKLRKGSKLLDFGCGNGRDSGFFAAQGFTVIAMDICRKAVELTASKLPAGSQAIVADGSNLPDILVDYAFARFVLHALTESEQDVVFRWMRRHVRGKVYIETRSINDPRYGRGKLVGRNAYIDTHFRRFISVQDLVSAASRSGYKVDDVVETHSGSGTDGARVLRATLSPDLDAAV